MPSGADRDYVPIPHLSEAPGQPQRGSEASGSAERTRAVPPSERRPREASARDPGYFADGALLLDPPPPSPRAWPFGGEARVLDGRASAAGWERELRGEVARLRSALGRAPALGIVVVGDRADSALYVERKLEAAVRVGVRCDVARLPGDAGEAAVAEATARFSDADGIDGVLVQLPLPPHVSEDVIADCLAPGKDVDGFHPLNVGRALMRGRAAPFVPATAKACFRLVAEAQGGEAGLRGKSVVVLGDSNVVGMPVAMLARDAGAGAVTVVHRTSFSCLFEDDAGARAGEGERAPVQSGAERVPAPPPAGDPARDPASGAADLAVRDPTALLPDLARICRTADVLLVAVGFPELVRPAWVKPGATVVDVGINVVQDERAAAGAGGAAAGPDSSGTDRPLTRPRPRRSDVAWPGAEGARAAGLRLSGDVDPRVARVAGALTPVPGGVGPVTIAATLSNVCVAARRRLESRQG